MNKPLLGSYIRTQAHKQTMNLHLRNGSNINCLECGTEVYKTAALLKAGAKYCSRKCSNNSPARTKNMIMSNVGRVMSEVTKEKLKQYKGIKASGYKGGRPSCKDCGKSDLGYRSTYCNSCKCKHRSPEHKERHRTSVSNSMKGVTPANNSKEGKYRHIKRGWYDINGKRMFFRSKWEANYALYLDYILSKGEIKSWTSEKKVYIFEEIKYGTRSYKPDFNVTSLDDSLEHHEVKGFMDEKSILKLGRMKLYYPDVKVTLIQKEIYYPLIKQFETYISFF